MADKAISQLNAAGQITATDLFVLQQNNEAKSLQGQVLLNWLTAAADGHGGISSITKTGTSGLVDTYRITLADTTTYDFTVTNGAKGDKGNTGQAWYMHIRYADHEPTQNSDMSTAANDWIGIYSGTSSSAPTSYTSYTWFKIKGEQGIQGLQGVSITSQTVTYQVSTSGTVTPSGTWNSSIPTVPQGQYLWTRTVTNFSDGRSPVYSYSVSRMGMDGSGSVVSINNVSPDSGGNVTLTGDNIRVASDDTMYISDAIANAGKVETVSGVGVATGTKNVPLTATNLPYSDSNPASTASVIEGMRLMEVTLTNVSDSSRIFNISGITANHTLVQNGCAYLSNPEAVGSDLTLTTGNGTISVAGTLTGQTNIVATFCVK